jgi:hypothetical protein
VVLSRHMPCGIEENHDKSSQDSRSHGRDLDLGPTSHSTTTFGEKVNV